MVLRTETCVPSAIFARFTSSSPRTVAKVCRRAIHLPTDANDPHGTTAAFLRPTEQLLDVPLTSEGVHNPTRAPVVAIRAQHPTAEPGRLQLVAQSGIDVPLQARGFVGSGEGVTTKLDRCSRASAFLTRCTRLLP